MSIEKDIPNAKKILWEIMSEQGVSVDEAYEQAVAKYGQSITFEMAKQAIKQEQPSH